MARFPVEHNFLLLQTFAVKHHFTISSSCSFMEIEVDKRHESEKMEDCVSNLFY